MPAVDYWAIEQEVAEILEANLPDAVVTVEDEQMFSPEQTPWIGVYMNRRAPSPNQPISAGQRLRYRVEMSIWVWCYHLERSTSFQMRDDAVSRIEIALLNEPRLNGKVEMSWIQGGELTSARVNTISGASADFLSGGEIRLVAEVMASTK